MTTKKNRCLAFLPRTLLLAGILPLLSGCFCEDTIRTEETTVQFFFETGQESMTVDIFVTGHFAIMDFSLPVIVEEISSDAAPQSFPPFGGGELEGQGGGGGAGGENGGGGNPPLGSCSQLPDDIDRTPSWSRVRICETAFNREIHTRIVITREDALAAANLGIQLQAVHEGTCTQEERDAGLGVRIEEVQ